MIDHVATAKAVADDINSKLPPEDALPVALYILTSVALRQGLGIEQLTTAIALAAEVLRREFLAAVNSGEDVTP